MPQPQMAPFAPWAPDLDELESVTAIILNVVPRGVGYGPVQSLSTFTQALPATCRGYFYARNSDGSVTLFAGTVNRLYKLNNTTFAWDDVSKGGVAYSDLAGDANWQFAQFNDLVIAVQANTPPQKYTLSGGGLFADLGGTPPQAGFVSIINRIVMLTGLLSNPRRAQWSDLDAPEDFTNGIADFQDMPDGGTVGACSGGDAYGLVFQQEGFRSLTYAPGSAYTFQINRVSANETLYAAYSVINIGERTFYLGASGFKMVVAGGKPEDIGKEQVNRYFFADVDTNNIQLIIAASDPTATRAYWAYKSKSGSAGLFDKIICYDWVLKRWAIWSVSGQYLASLAKPGLTLEALDAIAPTPLNVLGTADNGAGRIRLELNATSNAFFDIAGQNFITVYDVGGTTEANGSWTFTIIDATHIDLLVNTDTGLNSAYANAWTSGGHIGGSLDALPFSLDSISKSAVAQLSVMDSTSKLAFFNGDNMEAIVETPEADGQGTMLFTSGARIITDVEAGYLSTGHRKNLSADVTYTDEALMDDTGWAPQLIENRYLRGRLRIPAGSVWTYARGILADAQGAGER